MTSKYDSQRDNENAGTADENRTNAGGSIMDSLRGAGEAWLAAGSALGNAVGAFAANFREERAADRPAGAHSLAGEGADAQDTLGQQLRAAVDNARGAFNSADNDRDFRAAASSFATDAEGIFRDIAGSVSRAGGATAGSGEAEEVKAAFGNAVNEVRETFSQAVSGVRNRAEESDIDAEGTVTDLRDRLDSLIAKLSEQVNGRNEESADSADIIDGEVVRDTDQNSGNSTV
ncbi:hypothetical protein G7Y29_01100 [Corynebacterium qintianiae]|uniref:Uncharacterized protein n=1 Tax=Corynebacterium qintianiae TaxID=2709392 RepID=A0A7T0KNS7_9CORY|nr:CGLAU_01105 family protein [Corynebacterium qintianiae]QPK83449.1 hypothetical protein G7Y29_01100 [Corynebacterium qintianiae]